MPCISIVKNASKNGNGKKNDTLQQVTVLSYYCVTHLTAILLAPYTMQQYFALH